MHYSTFLVVKQSSGLVALQQHNMQTYIKKKQETLFLRCFIHASQPPSVCSFTTCSLSYWDRPGPCLEESLQKHDSLHQGRGEGAQTKLKSKRLHRLPPEGDEMVSHICIAFIMFLTTMRHVQFHVPITPSCFAPTSQLLHWDAMSLWLYGGNYKDQIHDLSLTAL